MSAPAIPSDSARNGIEEEGLGFRGVGFGPEAGMEVRGFGFRAHGMFKGSFCKVSTS